MRTRCLILSKLDFFDYYYLNFFYYYFEHIVHPSSYDSTASCLGASLSFGNAGLHGYGEGREEEGGGEKKKGRGVLSL